MRETCARVLAAALMTGAVAAALATPALFDAPRDQGLELTAPPSSHWRSVRVPALPAPRHATRRERLVVALSARHPAGRPLQPPPASRPGVKAPAPTRPAPTPPRTVSPPVKPPAPDTRTLAETTPAPAQPAALPAPVEGESATCKAKSNGNGKANGHCKNKNAPPEAGKPSKPTAAQPSKPTAAQPSPPTSAPPGSGPDDAAGQAHSHEHGKDKGHGKD
jgi:hypothetical protein